MNNVASIGGAVTGAQPRVVTLNERLQAAVSSTATSLAELQAFASRAGLSDPAPGAAGNSAPDPISSLETNVSRAEMCAKVLEELVQTVSGIA